MKEYNHKEIEDKWQKEWQKNGLYKTSQKPNEKSQKEYILVEFPYPSGNLHVGHWYAFAVSDIYARYRKMLGKDVLFPIGFDSFGLPAENAAIKNGVNPREWTNSNIEYMTKQLQSMGAMFDLDRKVVTSDPKYYKWTQWLFIQMLNKGIAFQETGTVNWCPSCKTVLANEQVISGKCERCESDIEQKEMKEWKLKITDYAEKLLEGLEKVDWPEHIKEAQRNWIGKSSGAFLSFPVGEENIKVFTTRPDTFFGITYLVLAPENKLIDEFKDQIKNWSDIEKYRKKAFTKTELQRISEAKEKTGVKLDGLFAKHPATGKELPIFISDYVIASYGTGAVMAVPAHDERDYEFAKKFDLEIVEVISGGDVSKEAYVGHGPLVNSDKYDGVDSQEAIGKITEDFGEKTVNYKIRDWSISRQRYWGCPIPVIHCEKCGVVPVEEKDLPIELPDLDDFLPSEDGRSPLAKKEDWVNVNCPKCGGKAERETDTFDTFIDSSWYFLRYLDPKNEKEFCSKEMQKEWMPVDLYLGGNEHTTMHLLYARFFQKVLFDLKLVENDEPFRKRNNRGLILGADGNKMSKSKGNVVDPDEYVQKLGSDTVRGYLAFMGPYGEAGNYPWDPNGVVGIRRFIERIFSLSEKVGDKDSEEVLKKLHKTIMGVSEDYQNLKFNTAISKLMILSNILEKEEFTKETFETVLKLLSPVAPHVCEELYQSEESIHSQKWPEYDPELVKETEKTLGIQVNGKVRAEIEVINGTSEEEVKKKVLLLPEIKKYTEGGEIKKFIYIEGKIISIVVRG